MKKRDEELGFLAKYNIAAVFNKIGGIETMVLWAQNNQTEFYKLYARLLPLDVKTHGDVTVITKHYIMEKSSGRVIELNENPDTQQLESASLSNAILDAHAERGEESNSSLAQKKWKRFYSDELDSESEPGESRRVLAYVAGGESGEESDMGREG